LTHTGTYASSLDNQQFLLANIAPLTLQQEEANTPQGLNSDLTPNEDGNVTLDVNAP
jgi:hypothetical protein